MKGILRFLIIFLLYLLISTTANALTVDTVSGIWTDIDGGDNVTGMLSSEIRWGSGTGTNRSGFSFDGNNSINFEIGESFSLGEFTHYNYVDYGSYVYSADLAITLLFSDPSGIEETLNFTFDLVETPNNATPTTNPANNDIVSFPLSYAVETFEIDNVEYTLKLIGFGDDVSSIVNQFSTTERASNTTTLWAQVTAPVPIPAAAWLLGSGLVGLVGLRRKMKK